MLGIQVSNKIQIQGKLGLIEPSDQRFACYLNSSSIPADCCLQIDLKIIEQCFFSLIIFSLLILKTYYENQKISGDICHRESQECFSLDKNNYIL